MGRVIDHLKGAMMPRLYIIVVLACCTLMGFGVEAHGGLRPRGDVNCDWRVSIDDVTDLISMLLNGVEYHSLYTYAADINSDKSINIEDVTCLIGGLLGKALPPMPSYSGTLPVLYINTDGHKDIVSKEEYLHADWWLDAMGADGYESIGSPEQPLGMQIKGRGNYTWSLSKKPFRIKFDTKQAILGMKKNRHFCLLAHADDHYAKLKNTMAFELSRRIGLSYTPEQRPVEIVLNGQYIGLYFLTEQIRVDKDRVNIEEQEGAGSSSDDLDGAWLLEIDNVKEDNTIYIKERNGAHLWYDWLWVTPHYPEDMSNQQRQYITQFLTTLNDAIYNPMKMSTEWENYIDIDSLACFYIVAEVIDNIECFWGSCFMHKHRGSNSKLIFGPVWDCGSSFMRDAYDSVTDYNYFIYQQPCHFHNHWIEEIAKFPHFQLRVMNQWRKFYKSGFNGLDIDWFIDDHVNSIRWAWASDAKRWKGMSIDMEALMYKLNIHSKVAWLQSQWGPGAGIDTTAHEVQPAGGLY